MPDTLDFIEKIAPIALIGVGGYFILKKLGILDTMSTSAATTTPQNQLLGFTTPIGDFGVQVPSGGNIGSSNQTTTTGGFDWGNLFLPYQALKWINQNLGQLMNIQSVASHQTIPQTTGTGYGNLTASQIASVQSGINPYTNEVVMTKAPATVLYSGAVKGAAKNSYASGDIKPSFWV